MKKIPCLTGLVSLVAIAVVLLLTSCAALNNTQRLATPGPVYETAEQIRMMPPCQARVTHRSPCSVYVKTVDGKGIYLGSPGSEPQVGRFLASLKNGRRYKFPDVFFNFQEKQATTTP